MWAMPYYGWSPATLRGSLRAMASSWRLLAMELGMFASSGPARICVSGTLKKIYG